LLRTSCAPTEVVRSSRHIVMTERSLPRRLMATSPSLSSRILCDTLTEVILAMPGPSTAPLFHAPIYFGAFNDVGCHASCSMQPRICQKRLPVKELSAKAKGAMPRRPGVIATASSGRGSMAAPASAIPPTEAVSSMAKPVSSRKRSQSPRPDLTRSQGIRLRVFGSASALRAASIPRAPPPACPAAGSRCGRFHTRPADRLGKALPSLGRFKSRRTLPPAGCT
jgi:hypothetical protein